MKDSISTAVIYDVIAYCLEEEAEKYPADVYKEELGKYSSLDKAEAAMRSCVITDDPSENAEVLTTVHSFAVCEIELDVGPKEWGTRHVRIYDSKGIRYVTDSSFSDDPFAGREASECRFQPGDFVEFISYRNKLEIGIVVCLPLSPDKVNEINLRFENMREKNLVIKTKEGESIIMVCDQSDDTYLVDHSADDFTHDHLPECRLFKPKFTIDDTTKKQLQEKFRLSHGTYKVYIGWVHRPEELKDLFPVELNDYMLDIIKEPHVAIRGTWRHLLISLLNFKAIKGDMDDFLAIEVQKQHYKKGQGSFCSQEGSKDRTDDFNKTVLFIKENQSLMIRDFNNMVDQHAQKGY